MADSLGRTVPAEWGRGVVYTLASTVVVFIFVTLIAPELLCGCGGGKIKSRMAESDVSIISQQVVLWMADYGHDTLPESFTLGDLASGPAPYVEPDDLVDVWGRPHVLRRTRAGFAIVSFGADGRPGGSGINVDLVAE